MKDLYNKTSILKNFLQKYHKQILLLFVVILGLTGSITPHLNKAFYIAAILLFGIGYFKEWTTWWQEHPYERRYLKVICLFVIYCFLLITIWSFLPNQYGLKPRYNDIEELLFTYILLPFFCIVIGLNLTQKTFEKTMFFYSTCVAINSFFLLYTHFNLSAFWDSPSGFFNNVMQNHFVYIGSNIPWIKVFMKDYALFPTLGALIMAVFMFRKEKRCIFSAVLFILNTFFMLLCNEKGVIIGFCVALIVIIAGRFWKPEMKLVKKIMIGIGLIAALGIFIFIAPRPIQMRFEEMFSEIKFFFTTNHDYGSTSIRLTIWKILLSHFKEFWIFGDGPMYATDKLRLYMLNAGYENYVREGFIYHNQYLIYFHHFGIAGLLFLPFLILYPIYVMFRRRRFSAIYIAILLFFAIILSEDSYLGKAIVIPLLFFNYFSFFQIDKWRWIEHNRTVLKY